ncbi:MAG: SMC family ATPase [Nanoarchaeota archaeon]|nr:SMC family ATPase [Nanoarchaeota archaeon]
MLLISLKLENIRSYSSEVIEFPEGSVLLSGDIGSGKSTILLAIEFALFGLLRGEMSGSGLLRHGQTHGSVELRFSVEGKEVIVKRTLKKARGTVSQDSGYVIYEDKKSEGTPVELKAKIIAILGYPEDLISKSKALLFRYTVYTPQEEMKHILFEDKDVRLDTLRKLFGIDKYKLVKENAAIFAREVRKLEDNLSTQIDMMKDTEEEKKKTESKLETLQKDQSALIEKELAIKQELDNNRKSVSGLEKRMKDALELRQGMAILSANISSRETNLASLDARHKQATEKIERYKDRIAKLGAVMLTDEKALEDSLNYAQERYNQAKNQNTQALAEKKHLSERSLQLKKDIETIDKQQRDLASLHEMLASYNEKLAKKEEFERQLLMMRDKEKSILSRLDSSAEKIAGIDESLARLSGVKACPLCNQPLDERHQASILKEYSAKIKEARESGEKDNASLAHVKEALAKLTANLERIREIEILSARTSEKIKALEELKAKKDSKLSELENTEGLLGKLALIPEDELRSELDNKKRSLADARAQNMRFREKENLQIIVGNEIENIEKVINEKISCDTELTRLKGQQAQASAMLLTFSETEKEFKTIKEIESNLIKQEKDIMVLFTRAKEEHRLLSERQKSLDEKLLAKTRLEEKLKHAREIEHWFDEFFIPLVSTIEKHVMVTIHSEFSSLLREWCSLLVSDLEIGIDDEFSIRISQDGYDSEIDHLSGGEKTAVALAYRLALNKVINDMISQIRTKDIIILDEPTDGFSSEQLDKVREVLEKLSAKQTIIVSHEQKLESFVESIIRIDKQENGSTVVK